MHIQIFSNFPRNGTLGYFESLRSGWSKLFTSCLCLFFFFGTAIGQNNLILKLGDESVLLDQLVVCGRADEQKVLFAIDGNNPIARTNITATLQLFEGIQFDNLNTEASTPGITLLNSENLNRPVFSFPDLDPNNLSQIAIVFSVKTDCSILDTLASSANLQVFDSWKIDYQLNGTSLTELFNGTEYKDALAVPNLNIFLEDMNGPFRVGEEVSRTITVTNSGLNSYLNSFVYQVNQEPGISYKSLIVNGTNVPFVKEITIDSDSLVVATISGDLFLNNTKELGFLGNNDTLFDVDEVLIIKEIFEITSCGKDGDSNLSSIHQANWGCDDATCRVESKPALISIGIGEELIQFVQNDATIDAGYCGDGSLSITVSNNGFEFDDGYGTIFDVSAGVGFAIGAEFLLADQGYQITTITIAGSVVINAPSGLVNLNNNPAFSTDPDGAGGLEDYDGDGFFDDLRVGQSFEIQATYSIDCSVGNIFDIEAECDNDLRASFDGKIVYSNSCGDGKETLFDNFYRSSNTGGTKEVCTDPDAFNDMDEFTVIYTGERRMSNFNRTCVGNDEIRVNISIPAGIVLSNKTNLQQDTFRYTPDIQTSGTNALLTFDASEVSLNNDYVLNLVFETQCASFGPTSFPIDISYYCPECDCSHTWFCGILEGAVLHSSGLPCSDFTCEIGLQTTNFEVERTTFGYTDQNFTNPFDPNTANKKVALACDSVVMKLTHIVGNQVLSDSVGFIINYGNADEKDSEAESFLFSHADIIISSGGNTRECTIDTFDYKVVIAGNNKQMYFEIGDCLNGITLNPGDEINFTGYFAVNADGAIPTNTFKKVPNFRAKGYAIIDGVTHDDCDSYGELFRLGKLNTTFSGPSNSSYPEGCLATALTYTLTKTINANAMREFFGEEHRQAAKVDDIQFTYDPALFTAFDDLSVEYRVQGSEWLPLPNLAEQNAGLYNAGFSLLSTASTITGSNQVFQIRINLIPGCSSEFGSTIGDDLYEIGAKINYKDRYFANFIGDGSCVEEKEQFDKRLFQYDNPPQFSLEGVVQDIQTAEENVQWIIEHCNTSFLADAGIGWIELENLTGDIEVLMIENISVSNAIDTLELKLFGAESNQIFAFTRGLIKKSTDANPEDICNVYRITAKMKSCGQNSVAARVGWNCIPYDAPNWNPALYPPCEEQSILLKAATLDPLLSADFVAAESSISGVLCDTSTMIILVRNEEGGNAYDVRSQIILPKGASLVSGSIGLAYPSSSAFQPIIDPNLLGENEFGKTYQYDNFESLSDFLNQNGLPGFNINATDSSEFEIKYRFITNCEYENGELNRYSFQGVSACGEPSNNAFAETNPIIFQADPGIARTFEIQASTGNFTKDRGTGFEARVQNVSENISANDKLEIELPSGFYYVENSSFGLPFSWNPGEPIIKNNAGNNVLNWLLPAGIVPGAQVVVQFKVMADDLVCDTFYTAKFSVTSSIEFNCTVDGQTCIYDFESSDEEILFIPTTCEDTTCIVKIGTETTSVLAPSCDSTIYYCLSQYSPEELDNYTITDNGVVVDDSRFGICDYQQVCIYTYANLNNIPGPIQVDSWTVDGVTHSSTVADITELVDSMNVWDEGGNWIVLPEVLILQGGHIGGDYSQMEVTLPSKGIRSILGYDTRLTPRGVSIFLNEGFHELIIKDTSDCQDILNVTVIRQDCPICPTPIIENIIIENANCDDETGVATIKMSDDFLNYTYEWAPNVGQIGVNENSRTNLGAGSYLVQITNKEDPACFLTIPLNIGNSDAPNATVTQTPATCNAANGTAQLVPANFQYTWSDGGTGANRTDLQAGNYGVTFTDPAIPDCSNILTLTIESQNNLAVSHSVFLKPNCLANNGVVSLDVTGGSGNYSTTFPTGGVTQTELSGGTYTVTVTDITTGCTIPYLFVLNNQIHSGDVVIQSITDLVCSADNNGAVVFEVDYENGFRFPADTIISDGVFLYENGNLTEGHYQIYILDGRGCVAGNSAFEIKGETPLTVNISKEGNCEELQSVSLEVSGGSPEYFYNWQDLDGAQNEKNRTNLIIGNYNVIISDSKNCGLDVPIVIEGCSCVPANILNTNIIGASCEQSNGAISLELEQDLANYTFTYNPDLGVEGATKNARMALPTGDYEITIIYKEDINCSVTTTVTVPTLALEEITITGTEINPADCGQSNGTVEIFIAQNIADYNFTWTPDVGQNGSGEDIRINLPPDNYEVFIAPKDDPNCGTTIPIIVPEKMLSADFVMDTTLTQADCGQSNGTATILITEDIANYDFTWTPDVGQVGSSKNERTNLPAGDYQILVAPTGSPDCGMTLSLSISEKPLTEDFITNTITTLSDCGQSNGNATIFIAADVADYAFTWTPNLGQTTGGNNTRSDLPAGDYQILIAPIGSPDCGITLSLSITENGISQDFITETIIEPAECGQNNGQVTLNINSDIDDYSFTWAGNAGQQGNEVNIRTDLGAGNYAVTVADINNVSCFFVINITVPDLGVGENPVLDTIITAATCGIADGQVEITLTQAVENYIFEWSPDVGTTGNTANLRSDLPEGDYEIIIRDAVKTDCFHSITVNVPALPPMATATVLPSQCNEPPSGEITLMPTTYTYTWEDGFMGNNRNLLAAGNYEITFADPNQPQCQGILNVLIEATNTLEAAVVINNEPTCGEANGSVTINTSGGSGNYSYSWDSENETQTNLAGGTYTVTVLDNTLGCQVVVDFSFEIIEPSVANISITDTIHISCAGETDGRVQFTVVAVDGFHLPMDTVITNDGNVFENGQLVKGDYCLEIIDNLGCLAGQTCFTIQEPEPVLITFETVAACADTGSVELIIFGGTSPYFIDWLDMEGVDNQKDRMGLDTGVYKVIVTDSNGCVDSMAIVVPECEACNFPTITEVATTPTSCTGNTGSVFIKMEENVSDYEFRFTPDFGQPFVTGNIRAAMPKGIYKILIIYKPNPTCEVEMEVEVFEKNFDDLVPITSPSECGFQTGEALILPPTNIYTWQDGFIGNSRKDLAAGLYQIRVRDDDFDCETAITIVIDETNLLEAKIAINKPPTCGNSNGSVTININGGSGDYTYGWTAIGKTKNDLKSGTYNILVTDNQTGCVSPVVFTLIDSRIQLVGIDITGTIDASCPLVADGQVQFSTNLLSVVGRELDTVISNGLTQFQNGRLPQGEYCISIVDTMGCSFGQSCFSIAAPTFLEVLIETIPQCEVGGSISTIVSGGIAPYTYNWADVEGIENGASRRDLSAGLYSLTVTDANLCQAIFDTVRIEVCEPCPLEIGKDTLLYHIDDCNGTLDICVDYDIDLENPFTLELDGVLLDAAVVNSCSSDTIDVYSYATLFGKGRLGPYSITSWPVNEQVFTGDFTSLNELVDSMNSWDPLGNWQFSEEGSFIIGGAPGSIYRQMDATVQSVAVESFLSHSTQIIQKGIITNLGVGVHEMTIQNPKTFCEDTLILVVSCAKVDTMEVITTPEHQDTFCIPTHELSGVFDTLIVDCLEEGLVEVTVYEDSCLIIKGVAVGLDTICVIICDELGICDTTIFEIEVLYEEIEDTLLVHNSNTICLDTTGLTLEGRIMTMTEICRTDSVGLVNYDLNVEDKCITYTARTLGIDSACIEICDDLGLCDTIEFLITVRNDIPDDISDTVFINETIIYCFDSIIFPGEIVFFENICPENSGSNVDFFLDPITFCVEYSGVDIGKDSACVVLCDNFGNCDTALFSVEVIEFLELPTAIDDVDTTDKGVPIVLNVKENDIPFGVEDDGMFILDDPLFGEVFQNLDGSITYFGDEFCERTDQFSYVLCNDNGCDTATVTIYIRCIDIVIFTAVSPNQDGINDEFYIAGVEEFPLSELVIYNRWGNIVYRIINYQNDWTGTWKGNQELPDGTYFYHLILNDPNDDRKFEGFFELHR